MAEQTARKVYKLLVANGALLQAPVYENRASASNWLAAIDVDKTMPGGLSRRWMNRGRGECLYDIEQLSLFDAVEFAADYTNSVGGKKRDRWFGVVVAKTDGYLLVEQAKSGAWAVLRAKEARTSLADRVAALEAEKEDLIRRAAALDAEIAQTVDRMGAEDEHGQEGQARGESGQEGGVGVEGGGAAPESPAGNPP